MKLFIVVLLFMFKLSSEKVYALKCYREQRNDTMILEAEKVVDCEVNEKCLTMTTVNGESTEIYKGCDISCNSTTGNLKNISSVCNASAECDLNCSECNNDRCNNWQPSKLRCYEGERYDTNNWFNEVKCTRYAHKCLKVGIPGTGGYGFTKQCGICKVVRKRGGCRGKLLLDEDCYKCSECDYADLCNGAASRNHMFLLLLTTFILFLRLMVE